MKKPSDFIFKSRLYLKLIEKIKSKHVTKDHISLYLILRAFDKQISKDFIVERAQAMAFNFMLSIFPAVIFLFTLIPYIPFPSLDENIMRSLEQVMPRTMFETVASTISDIISIPRGGLLSFGFLFTIITSCNGIMAMSGAFNRCYKTKDSRNFLRKFLTAFSLVTFITLIIFISISLSVIAKVYLDILEKENILNHDSFIYLIQALKYLVLTLVFFMAISMIYYMAPTTMVRWGFFSAGTVIATILSVLFTIVFSFYIDNFEAYNKLYGSIGAFIGLMLWLFAISLVLLIGFEINASIDMLKRDKERQLFPERVMDDRHF